MTDVAIVDYGMGNLRSVYQAVRKVAPDAVVRVTDSPEMVAAAGRVVFPGQGAMRDCMREMEARGLRQSVLDAARNKPFLGICIGLQMLFEGSDEGDVAGLGLLAGRVRRFPATRMVAAGGTRLKVPHMGWNRVRQERDHALWQGIEDGARFYFVHSYYVEAADPGIVAGSTDYGFRFTSAVADANIFAVQFHPEKSAQAGLRLLENFLRWKP